MNNKIKNLLKIFLVFVVVCIIGSSIYISSYYHATKEVETSLVSNEQVEVDINEKRVVLKPKNYEKGIIFYPGAKVEYSSYVPMFKKLAEKGILCIVLHSPGNIAFLDIDGANEYIDAYTNVKSWYVAGHSLGGIAASSYAYSHSSDVEGLILLASYSTKDLRDSSLKCLSIVGDKDGVINKEKMIASKKNLPKQTSFITIEGGNHDHFGYYGNQKGDHKASITRENQQAQGVEAIYQIMN